MEYNKDNIVGLKVRHKDYAVDDIIGHYEIVAIEGKTPHVKYYQKRDKKTAIYKDWTISQIKKYIKDGVWIVREEPNPLYTIY